MDLTKRIAMPILIASWFAACAPAAAPDLDDPVRRLSLQPSFAEEFDGSALNKRKWGVNADSDPVDARTLSSNSEHQVYLTPGYLGINEQPMAIGGGLLTITAKPLTAAERYVVQAAVRALPADKANSALKDIEYGSGRTTTHGKFSQLYGYFEMRARVPAGRGLWPAFWLLPEDGGWPPEIDVMEVLGHESNKVYQTLHSSAAKYDSAVHDMSPSSDGFHRYGALWQPDTVTFYVDGAKVNTVKTPADMHKPMYMILNLAVGGSWPGYPDANTSFPARMDIDYVRAWKFAKRPGSAHP